MKRKKHHEENPLDAYDMIVIGTGEKGKSTIKTLKEQGQEVMFVELSPEMIATMVCHHPHKNASTPQNNNDKHDDESIDSKIHIQQQSISTQAGETITYTFHVAETTTEEKEVPEAISEEEVIETITTSYSEVTSQDQTPISKTTYPYLAWTEDPDKIELNELPNIMSGHTDPLNTKNLFAELEPHEFHVSENEFKISRSDKTNHNHIEEIESVALDSTPKVPDTTNDYLTFLKGEQEDQDKSIESVDEETDQDESPKQYGTELSLELMQKLKPSSLSQQKAKEISIREKSLNQKKSPETVNLFDNFHQETITPKQKNIQKEESYKERENTSPHQTTENTTPIAMKKTEMDRSSFLDSVLNKPVYSPKDSRLRKRANHKSKQQTKLISASDTQTEQLLPASGTPQQTDQVTDQSVVSQEPKEEQQKVYPIEPFSTRRRARVQKKNRILSTVERFQANHQLTTSDIQEQTAQTQLEIEPSSTDQFTQQSKFPAPKPKQVNNEEFFATNPLNIVEHNQETDSLKRDDIEFEEPYGYNSWEDFMYPSSQNNRKRQEMDEVKKRKIALRGLHNLINNLG